MTGAPGCTQCPVAFPRPLAGSSGALKSCPKPLQAGEGLPGADFRVKELGAKTRADARAAFNRAGGLFLLVS